MRKLVNILVVLAAVCFLFGTLGCFLGSRFFPWVTHGILPAFQPETYWRGATGLLLFAITLIMLERTKGQGH